MQKELIQKKGFSKREAKIMETKVVYKSTLFKREYEISIAYEDLSKQKESYLLNRKNFYIPVICFGIFTLASFIWRNDKEFDPNIWILWGILFLISTIIYLLSLESLWKVKVHYNSYLFFFKNLPSKEEVDGFIKFLFETRDKYLKETYFLEPNKNLSFESQKNNLQWLRKSEVITAIEFQSGMKKLEEVFNQDLKKIGFN